MNQTAFKLPKSKEEEDKRDQARKS